MSSSNAVSFQVNSILYPTSYDHIFLQSFVDEGCRNSRGDGKTQSEGLQASVTEPAMDKGKASKSRAESAIEPRRSKRGTTRRQEEIYTDKDRAAAVNMGSEDIKHSLKVKGKREGKERPLAADDDNMEPHSLLIRGLQELRSGNVKIAITSVNQALDLSPRDKNALIARSKCYLLLGEPLKALTDAEKVLEDAPKDSTYARAIYYKAEALYALGNFEMSLVYYYRGREARPELDKFRLGIQKAKNAIRRLLCKKNKSGPE